MARLLEVEGFGRLRLIDILTWPASGEVDPIFTARRGWAHRRVELAQVERVPIPLNLPADDSPLFRRQRTLASWEKP